MEPYTIDWLSYDFEDGLKAGFNKSFLWYAIFVHPKRFGRLYKNAELIYIGKAIAQSVSDRLLGNHKALKSALTDFGDRKIGISYASCTEEIDDNIISDILHHLSMID